MFQKYYEFIQRTVSNLGNKSADISFESYIKVVLSSLWIIITYLLFAFSVAGVLSAPYFMYSLIIKKKVYAKNKSINEKIRVLADEHNSHNDTFHEKFREDKDRYGDYNNKLRDELHEAQVEIRSEINKLVESKDLSVIWKTYLMVAPILLVYLAFAIPLILIVIDLVFKSLSVTLATVLLDIYFIVLIGAIFKSYESLYYKESKVTILK